MEAFPKRFGADDAPATVVDAVRQLMPKLLEGSGPFVSTLRRQYEGARISSITVSGCGFFVDFDVPTELTLTDPPEYTGGGATLSADTAPSGGGCLLFVTGGRPRTLEVYTFGDEVWTERTRLTRIGDVISPSP